MIIEVCLKREQEIGLAFSDRAHVICEIPKALYYILYFPMFFLLILFLLLKSQIFLILYLIKRFTRKQVLHVEKKNRSYEFKSTSYDFKSARYEFISKS